MENITTDWRDGTISVKDRLKYILVHEHEDTKQDVVIIAGCGSTESKIIAHSLVLYIGSKVLAEMLDKGKVNNDGLKEIKVPDVHPEAFKFILKYLYADCLDLQNGDAIDILYAALKFNLIHLATHCISELQEEITTENVLRLYEQANKLKIDDLLYPSQKFISNNAGDIFRSQQFLCISNESLCKLLAQDDLRIDEISVFKSVLKWGKAECERSELEETADDLRYVLKKIIPLIRFSLMTIEDFSTVVEPADILDESETLELYKYFSLRNSNLKTNISPPKWIVSTKQRITLDELSSEAMSSSRTPIPFCDNVKLERRDEREPTEISVCTSKKEKLLTYLKVISGSKTISGVYVTYTGANRNKGIDYILEKTGVYPGVINLRMPSLFQTDDEWQSFVDEIISHWNSGHLIHIVWWDNALTSMDVNNYTDDSDETKWNDLINNEGHMNKIWKAQLDNVAKYLLQLEAVGVVAICDLLPNINDKWLYWRGRRGIDGSAKLYQMTKDYIENHHGLNSLIWAWSLHVSGDMDHLEEYWPGSNYVDVVSVYMRHEKELPAGANQNLIDLIGDKPLSMEYIYSVPTLGPDSLRWTWFTAYDDSLVKNGGITMKATISKIYKILQDSLINDYVINKGNIDFFKTEAE